jgi:flagellum-specific peptidoglycan hydrolase FlgJ
MANDDIVYQVGIDNGLTPAAALNLTAQARLESGNYTSNLFRTDNNAFGYKYVGQFGASKGILAPQSEWNNPNMAGYYAHYKDLNASALEVVKWIKRRINEGLFTMGDLQTANGYAYSLKQGGYYGETAYEYSQDLSSIINKYLNNFTNYVKKNENSTILIAGVIIAVILIVKRKKLK